MKKLYTRNKFHAIKVKDDGITFDSKKEHERFCELRLLERAGEIENLLVHVPYIIIPKSKYGKEIDYICDFQYFDGEKVVLEDVKGLKKGSAYQLFRLKKRLMQEIYNIDVVEI